MVKTDDEQEFEVAELIAHVRWTDETIQINPKLIQTCRPLAKKIMDYLYENAQEY